MLSSSVKAGAFKPSSTGIVASPPWRDLRRERLYHAAGGGGRRHAGGPVTPEALNGADALAILTEWGAYQRPDFDAMIARMASPVIFDGRNLYDPQRMRELGFVYYSIGRPAVL